MKKFNFILFGLWVCLAVLLYSCTKYLDTKPNQSLAIPNTLQDMQAMLDIYYRLNNTDPGSAEASADDYYLTYPDWSTLSEPDRRLYTWENDQVYSNYQNDWSRVYSTVYICNVILSNIENIKINQVNQSDWNNIKGSALLFRAKAFFQAAIIWGASYNSATANSTLGIPLRTTQDFNIASTRSSLQETYDKITTDLKEAADLLNVSPLHIMRPSRPAAYGLLARAYLSMGKYDSCKRYADACLQLKNTLLNYNTLNATVSFPIAQFNTEVIMENLIAAPLALSITKAKIDSTLYASYAANDLRKSIFFKNNNNGSYGFKGSYEGGSNLFSGVAVDEVYLMRAEANVKTGNAGGAINDLNTLLQTRWKAGTYVPVFSNISAADLLQLIRTERRKELLMRGLRWIDLKRLNEEGANISLTRSLNGQPYVLPPNDLRYAIAIPEEIIKLSGISQNPR